MPIDQKIATRSVFILADPRLHNRSICQGGESVRNVPPNLTYFRWRHHSRLPVRIDPLAVFVQRDLQPAALQVRHSITFVIFDQPGRQSWSRKSRVSARNPEIKHALPRRENSIPQDFRKKL